MDNILFYFAALILPMTFLLLGSFFRWLVKRKWDWDLLYLGMDVALAGIGTALAHIVGHEKETGETQDSRTTLLNTSMPANTHTGDHAGSPLGSHVPPVHAIPLQDPHGLLPQLSYATRGVFGVFVLLLALFFATGLSAYFAQKVQPLTPAQRRAEIFWLAIIANGVSTGMVVLMERLLR